MIKTLQSLVCFNREKSSPSDPKALLINKRALKIYKVKMKTCENMQTRKTTGLQTVEPFRSEVRVVMVMMNAEVKRRRKVLEI